MYIVAEPVTEDQVKDLQTRNDAKIEEFEHNILGLNKSSDHSGTKVWDNIHAEVQKIMDQDESYVDGQETDVESHLENQHSSISVDHDLNSSDNTTIVDSRGNDAASHYAKSSQNSELNNKDSEDEADETEEEEGDEGHRANLVSESENGEDELQDESSTVNVQEDDEVDEEDEDEVDEEDDDEMDEEDEVEVDEDEGEDEEIEEAERVESEETIEQEDPVNKLVDLEDDMENEFTESDQSTAVMNTSQDTENRAYEEGTFENDAKVPSKFDGSNIPSPSEGNDEVPGEPSSLSDAHMPNDSELHNADVSFLEQIEHEQAEAKPSNEILLMILTIRNKVNNRYQPRPTSLHPDDDWTVEYSLAEEPKQDRAWNLYQAIQMRRKRQLDREEAESETTVTHYVQKMRQLSAQGKKWREEQDQKYDGSPKKVLGQSTAETRPSGGNVEASPST